ncbi:hypothetical protein [Pseudomonas sp. BF-RE-24]|nr:hypothetical protein [Pseudomonas sp. BF-RE-24]
MPIFAALIMALKSDRWQLLIHALNYRTARQIAGRVRAALIY